MTDLGPDARSFLDAVRDADDPSAADAARIRTGIALRLGAAAAAGTAATLGAKGASAGGGAGAASVATAATGGALATKVIVGLALVSTVGVGAVALRANAPPPPPMAVRATAASTSTREEPAPAEVTESRAPVAPAPSTSAKTVAPAVSTSPRAAPAAPDRLSEEAGLIRAANTALSSGDATTCLARLDDHAARFPRGALSEERGATRVHALCAAGRVTEARAAASAFVAAHPRSALAPAVRRSCTTE